MNNVEVFVDYNSNIYSFQEDLLDNINKYVKNIINNDFFFENKNNYLYHLSYSNKIIIKNKEIYNISIYYIPKHWIINENTNLTLLKKDLISFNKFIENENGKFKKNKAFLKNKPNINYIEFEYDLLLLKKIEKQIQKININKKSKNIKLDILKGKIDKEANKYNRNKGLIYQTIKIKDDKIMSFINSYIKLKFNNIYIKFIKNREEEVFKNITKSLNKIKKQTTYTKQNKFLNKGSLKNTLLQKNNLLLYNNNKVLFKELEKLIKNKSEIINSYLYRKTFKMDNIWEKYIEKNFYNNIKVETQKSRVFISDNEKNETKISRPDFIGSTFISDAKYKVFKSLTKISDADIDKLIRDITINEKDNGKLIFPKSYNVQDKLNYENIEKFQYKFKIKSLEKNIEIILLPFSFN